MYARLDGVRVEVNIEWESVGSITASGDDLSLPDLPREPGIYQWIFRHDGRERRYVGEAANLYQRFRGYARPGKSQSTNVRMKARARRVCEAGGSVELLVATTVEVTCDGQATTIDLADQHHRYVAEATAIVALRETMGEIVNGKGFGTLRKDPVLG
jgi:hypothetical protein